MIGNQSLKNQPHQFQDLIKMIVVIHLIQAVQVRFF